MCWTYLNECPVRLHRNLARKREVVAQVFIYIIVAFGEVVKNYEGLQTPLVKRERLDGSATQDTEFDTRSGVVI